MKTILHAVVAALLIGAANAASAAHDPMHHGRHAGNGTTLDPTLQQRAPARDYWGFSGDPLGDVRLPETGGPVGGLGS